MPDLSFTHYQLSNAPSLVSVRAINAQCHNTFSPGVDGLPTSPVTSLPPDFRVIQMLKKFFEVRFGMYSSPASQRTIARLCTSNKTLNVTKHSFVVYTHFPHRPVTSLPFRLSGDPHAKKFFWCQIWNVLISSFRTHHRSSLYEECPSGSHKTLVA